MIHILNFKRTWNVYFWQLHFSAPFKRRILKLRHIKLLLIYSLLVLRSSYKTWQFTSPCRDVEFIAATATKFRHVKFITFLLKCYKWSLEIVPLYRLCNSGETEDVPRTVGVLPVTGGAEGAIRRHQLLKMARSSILRACLASFLAKIFHL